MSRIKASQQHTFGHASVDLRVGPIRARTLMHVMNSYTSYHLIFGCPWLKAHKVIASTYHQCVKVVWKGKPMTIKATKMPYDRAKLHHAEAALYQEFEPEEENMILLFNATVLEREKEDDGEVLELDRPSNIRKITKPDGKVVYEF